MMTTDEVIKKHIKLIDYHYFFDIELTTNCNLSCIFCPREKIKREQNKMTKKQVDKLVEWLPEKCSIMFSGLGEPLMDKRIFELTDKLASSQRIIGITTNGQIFNHNIMDNLLNSRINFLQISLNSIDEKKYTEITSVGKNTKLIKNIEYILAHKNHNLNVQISIIKDYLLPDDLKVLHSLKKKYEIDVFLKKQHNRGGHLNNCSQSNFQNCYLFSQFTFINSDGDILSCCHDVESNNILGNIARHSFGNIIKKKKYIINKSKWFKECMKCDDIGRNSIVKPLI